MELETMNLRKKYIPQISSLILNAENFGEPFLKYELSKLNDCLRSEFRGGLISHNDPMGIVGFLTFELRFRSIHILTMITHHNHLRKGIGSYLISKLINQIETEYPNIQVLRVDTGDFMIYAQKFYISNGFQVCGYVSHDFSWYNHQVHFSLRVNND